MALKDYPDWVLKYKEHNKEIRLLNNKYYLYQVHTIRTDGKVKKITDKYLGRITVDGLIPPIIKHIDYSVKEYYSTCFVFSICSNVITYIIDKYPVKSDEYLPICFLNVLFNYDLVKWNKSYLSILFPNVKLIKHTKKVNEELDKITSMMKYHIDRFLNNTSLPDFFNSINDLYMVGVKDSWTLAKVSEETLQTLNKYKIDLEINYGKSK